MKAFSILAAHSGMFMLFSTGTALATPTGHELLFASVQNAAAITDADRKAIYTQMNLMVSADGKSLTFTNDIQCPPLGAGDIQVATEDLNGDKHPEIFISVSSACMYGAAGIGVTAFIKDVAGHRINHNIGAGMYSVEKTRNKGYADIMIGGPGFCHPVVRWNGSTYDFHHKVAEQSGGCDGQ